MKRRIAAAVIGVVAALSIAAAVTRGGGSGVHTGGPLVWNDAGYTRTALNPQARPMLAESVALENSGKRMVVLDRVRILGATAGLHLSSACVSWHSWKSSLSPKTGPGDFFLEDIRNVRPKAEGTGVPPGRFFSVELSLRFSGRPAAWIYRKLEVHYHVGRTRYKQTYDVTHRFWVCRTVACRDAVIRNRY